MLKLLLIVSKVEIVVKAMKGTIEALRNIGKE